LYSGEVFKGNVFKQHEVVDLLLDPEELVENKELRNKKALLHVKKTGHKKVEVKEKVK
jgi:hypothetical protein